MRKTARDTIINSGSSVSDIIAMSADRKFGGHHLTHFRPDTQDEVSNIIMESPSKSCKLDPLPADLLKKMQECPLPLTNTIINESLVESHVLMYFKKAHVILLIKKPNLDKEVLIR